MLDGVLEDAIDYMKERKAFGSPIGQFQALQHYIADIATMRTTDRAAGELRRLEDGEGHGLRPRIQHGEDVASENANKAADLGIQILGGMGYSAEDRHAALLARRPLVADRADHERDGAQRIAESLGLPRSF